MYIQVSLYFYFLKSSYFFLKIDFLYKQVSQTISPKTFLTDEWSLTICEIHFSFVSIFLWIAIFNSIPLEKNILLLIIAGSATFVYNYVIS